MPIHGEKVSKLIWSILERANNGPVSMTTLERNLRSDLMKLAKQTNLIDIQVVPKIPFKKKKEFPRSVIVEER